MAPSFHHHNAGWGRPGREGRVGLGVGRGVGKKGEGEAGYGGAGEGGRMRICGGGGAQRRRGHISVSAQLQP